MPFHVKRTDTSSLETLQQYNGLRTTRWVQPPQGRSVLEIQTTHRPTELQKVPEGKNFLTPPYHCMLFSFKSCTGDGRCLNGVGGFPTHVLIGRQGIGTRTSTSTLGKGAFLFVFSWLKSLYLLAADVGN